MNTPDIKTLKKVIANQANKQEASDVIHWMNTSEGESFLSNEIDADLQNYTPEITDDYLDAPVPKEEMFNFILQQIRQRQWKKRIWKAARLRPRRRNLPRWGIFQARTLPATTATKPRRR